MPHHFHRWEAPPLYHSKATLSIPQNSWESRCPLPRFRSKARLLGSVQESMLEIALVSFLGLLSALLLALELALLLALLLALELALGLALDSVPVLIPVLDSNASSRLPACLDSRRGSTTVSNCAKALEVTPEPTKAATWTASLDLTIVLVLAVARPIVVAVPFASEQESVGAIVVGAIECLTFLVRASAAASVAAAIAAARAYSVSIEMPHSMKGLHLKADSAFPSVAEFQGAPMPQLDPQESVLASAS
jgi:hypothetical protein